MIAYRRTSTFALKALATKFQGAVAVGSNSVGQARADFGMAIGNRYRFSSLPDHTVVGMPGINRHSSQGACCSHQLKTAAFDACASVCLR